MNLQEALSLGFSPAYQVIIFLSLTEIHSETMMCRTHAWQPKAGTNCKTQLSSEGTKAIKKCQSKEAVIWKREANTAHVL